MLFFRPNSNSVWATWQSQYGGEKRRMKKERKNTPQNLGGVSSPPEFNLKLSCLYIKHPDQRTLNKETNDSLSNEEETWREKKKKKIGACLNGRRGNFRPLQVHRNTPQIRIMGLVWKKGVSRNKERGEEVFSVSNLRQWWTTSFWLHRCQQSGRGRLFSQEMPTASSLSSDTTHKFLRREGEREVKQVWFQRQQQEFGGPLSLSTVSNVLSFWGLLVKLCTTTLFFNTTTILKQGKRRWELRRAEEVARCKKNLSRLNLTAFTSLLNSSSMTHFFFSSSQIMTFVGGNFGFLPPPTSARKFVRKSISTDAMPPSSKSNKKNKKKNNKNKKDKRYWTSQASQDDRRWEKERWKRWIDFFQSVD